MGELALVWLDEDLTNVNIEHYQDTITDLTKIIDRVETFNDADECIDFITDHPDYTIITIVSQQFSENVFYILQTITQVSRVYIINNTQDDSNQWSQQYSKVKGVFPDIISISPLLTTYVERFKPDAVKISIAPLNSITTEKPLNQQDQTFMYTQILKEILLEIDFHQENIDQFSNYCESYFKNDPHIKTEVQDFKEDYANHSPIWWYTKAGFLYTMLNKALRDMEIDTIVNIGFFLQDLHESITTAHNQQISEEWYLDPFTVYRGQALSTTHLDQIKAAQGGLLSFNCFLSTSTTKDVSDMFSQSRVPGMDTVGVIFEIHLDPAIKGTPFAYINTMSAIPDENEILFTMHSVFRIDNIKLKPQSVDIWEITLKMTQDTDPKLAALTDQIRTETESYDGWYRLGLILLNLAQHNSAQNLWNILLHQAESDEKKSYCYTHLGNLYQDIGFYSEAQSNYEKALEIEQKSLPPDHPTLATTYNNIGSVYSDIGRYEESLSNHEKALEIQQKSLPPDHPRLGASYCAFGLLYSNMGRYEESLSNYEKALEIQQKSLPPNHPDLATIYNNIGGAYSNIGRYEESLSNHEKALEIQQKSLPPDHPDLAAAYSNIGALYSDMGRYEESVSNHEKALEIRQKSLQPDHPDLATTYNNIGVVYSDMGRYEESLSNHEKALEIQQKSLPPNHLDLATTYNNVGWVYSHIGKYLESLTNHEKALEIQQKSLPPDHPDLATTNSSIAMAHAGMQRYTEKIALEAVTEKSAEIEKIEDKSRKSGIWFCNCCIQ